MQGARLHKTSRRDAMARDPRQDLLGWDKILNFSETRSKTHRFETKTRLRHWGFCPRRDRDETLVRLKTVSRPRRLDWDHIPDPCVACTQVSFIDDVRQVLHLFWLFIPLPIFWALYGQQVCLLLILLCYCCIAIFDIGLLTFAWKENDKQ